MTARTANGEGTGPEEDRPVVLVVDDETRVTQAFALWLDDYDVRRAAGGEEALEMLDDEVDVVLLDRQMPGLSGDEVLDRIRERGVDCRVAMVTGVDPDFDIVDMPFDDYLTKPVDEEDLQRTVDELVRLSAYGDGVQQLFALANKQASLEAKKPAGELAESDAYRRLMDRLETTQTELDDLLDRLDPEEYEKLFRDLPDT